ncbi:MAG TPA: acylphosphatase [Chthoniobacterales bacterium]
MIAKQVFFEGNVQGVGFRFTTKHIASGFDVTGWVRNLADGRVEMLVQGAPNEVTAFVSEIGQSVLAGHIDHVFEHPATVDKTLRGFSIKF